ncbi:aminoglycoside phosphotransferase [Rhizobium leguminosarum bv. viciae]|uniref:aminoglycoside phosphotransferase n=1 Tax=Rhizobium leguminosarum TaxID=384 RepID=UPI0014427F24|nr:aminoglycoside phosphotransferase [Rhizobium leguminosarum]NKK16968.1 aminoglycoside phosphotransferase [Rhizobium leguminosarum bv. viciae]
MLQIADRALPHTTTTVLTALQAIIDVGPDYAARVALAKKQWDGKTGSVAKAAAFHSIRATLDKMCVGPRRCAYCEDSLADEIEHILPKDLFPQNAFRWSNYLFACGPCNGPKSNRYGVLDGNAVSEFIRVKNAAIIPPPDGIAGCIDPRSEDPTLLLELDLGGTTPDGSVLEGTFNFMAAEGLPLTDLARAEFTIDVLSLNREIMRVARESAFTGFRARLREYVVEKNAGAAEQKLGRLRDGVLNSSHLTVFSEMRRQRQVLPDIRNLLEQAPEAMGWSVVRA